MMLDGFEFSPFLTLNKGDSTMKADFSLKPFIFFKSLKVSDNHETHEQNCACVWNIQGFENSETSCVRACL